ncbi:MAG: phosphate ABC transporter permease PstA [Candidatus Nezhaarchaeota archaeon]|nr:phosphate ABC transporter permease PstA [Candidatus Nezhaarchaeota archaeon]MCX8141817.1 phosphate ABC transporter permease PstA [Candidatus Nezhaarchaeota archaeon]MDW8050402.1 phosphate ABC transporter permease PstA [Nitrososphaerota archaeon]
MRESNYRFRRIKSLVMQFMVYLALLLALIPLSSIIFEVARRGLVAINLDFFTKPTPTVGEAVGGVANAIQGTLITIGLASLISVPIGIISGIFLSEYGESKLSTVIRFFNEVLNGVPSIIIGIFSYAIIVLSIGFSVIAAAFALAIIMIPIVTRTTEEALKIVPATIREAVLALGAPKWKTTLYVVLRGAKKAIATGVMLAVARIAGESAPVLVTMGFWKWWFVGLDKPVANLALNIFLFASSPFENWVVLAWGSALILMVMILGINIGVRILTRGRY